MALDKETNTPKFESTPRGFLAEDAELSIRGGSDSFDQQTRLSQMANLSVVPETAIDKDSYTYKNDPKDIDVEGGTKESITVDGDITLLPQDKERKKLKSLAGELEFPDTGAVPFSNTTVPLATDTYGTSNIASAIVGEADDSDYIPDEYEAIETTPMEFPSGLDLAKDVGQGVAQDVAVEVGGNYASQFLDYEVRRKIATTMPYVGGQAVQNLSRGTGLPFSMAEKAKFLSNGALPADAVVVTQTGILPAPGTVAAGGPAVADAGFFERNFGGMDWGKMVGRAASAYNLYEGLKGGIPERDQDKIGVALDAAALYSANPAVVTAAAFWKAATFFGDWFMHGRHGKPKYAKGGADLKSENGKLMATTGYGYNNYKIGAGQAGAASSADYVNSYVKYFGLNFNSKKWNSYVAKDSRMGRYDTENMSGYRDPTMIIRKALESNGVITGNPTVNGIPIANQDDYMAKMKQFNKYYKKTAMDRGGLVDAKAAGVTQELKRSNVPDQIAFKQSTQVGGAGTGKNYTTKTTGGNRSGGGTTETGYWRQTGGGGRGGGGAEWVPAAPNVVTEQGNPYSGGGAYAISYKYEDVENPYDVLYYNLTGQFNRGSGGTGY